jgi:hypothetical protein
VREWFCSARFEAIGDTKIMRENIAKLFLLLIVCGFAQIVIAQTRNFSRPTITAVALKDVPFYHQKVNEDDDYLFAYRHYGDKDYTPGFCLRKTLNLVVIFVFPPFKRKKRLKQEY